MSTSRRRAGQPWAWVIAIVVGLPTSASAGELERLNQILINERDPELIALRYKFGGMGVMVSRDGGASFQLLCANALEPNMRPSSGLFAADGTLMVGDFDGLFRDDGDSCGWTRDPALSGLWVSDMTADPIDPDVVYAISSRGEPVENGVFRREGSGDFEALGSRAPMIISRLHVVRTDGDQRRFYQSASYGTSMLEVDGMMREVPNYMIRVSDDDASTWVEHAVPITADVIRLEAVDPTRPDWLVISSMRSDESTTLLVSRDAGASFEPYLELDGLASVVILPDGSVYIGDSGSISKPDGSRGVYRAASLEETPALLSGEYAADCLAYRALDDTLYVCQRFSFGILDRESGDVERLFEFKKVETMVSCDDRDVPALCEMPLLNAYCGISHFPCAPMCDALGVDLSPLEAAARSDAELAACLARRPAPEPPEPMSMQTPMIDLQPSMEMEEPRSMPPASEPAPQQPPGCHTLPLGRAGQAGGAGLCALVSAWLASAALVFRKRRRS